MTTSILVVLAVISACVGVVSLSEATMGVGFICLACLLGILGRIAQASDHRVVPTADPVELGPDGRIHLRTE